MAVDHTVESVEGLRAIYRPPAQRSLDKEIDHLDAHCRSFISHSPFAVLATSDGRGRVDVSPKGGPAGFVKVLDDHRLALPDMAGNNRLDSMGNIVRAAGLSLLFMVPGVGETLRVVGQGSVTVHPAVLDACPIGDVRPNVALVVEVSTAFIHCAKALRRSGLWEPSRWPSTEALPSAACILRDHIGMPGTVEESQSMLDQSYAATTWAMGAVSPAQ